MDPLTVFLISLLIIIIILYSQKDDKKKRKEVYKKSGFEQVKPILKPIKKDLNSTINKKEEANSNNTNNNNLVQTSQTIPFSGFQKNTFYKIRETYSGYEVNFHDYYYPNRIGNFTIEQSRFRQLVFNFKDGISSMTIAKLVGSCLYTNYQGLILANKENIVFFPIPASTTAKNKSRYEQFCKVIFSDLNIINGYYFIEIINDRLPNKGNRNASRVSNLKYNNAAFKGKTVFLFDDIFTFGKSFSENASKIRAAGAKNVIGIFLGKTYYNG